MAGRRILLTGTSGIGMSHVLEQLREVAPKNTRFCKAEKHFLEHVEKTGLVENWRRDPATEAMIRALALPQQILLSCWRAAFLELAQASFPDLNDTPQAAAADGPVVLAAHMCFFHQQSREFVPLVDTRLLIDKFEPDLIVTLIDDVEHMFTRLRRPAQMYAEHVYAGFGGVARACQDLSQLVHWRASEFAFAKTFARNFELDHFLLAVKHPARTLAALLFQPNQPRVYLSHAISEPRRLLAAGKSETWDAFCEGLERASAALRSRLTLFEPTAIDEFRFRSFVVEDAQGEKGEPIFLPATTTRWPLLAGGKGNLWSSIADDNPVDPGGHFTSEQLADFEAATKTVHKKCPATPRKAKKHGKQAQEQAQKVLQSLVDVENATHLVESLVWDIGRSVTSRDLKLVEQADHLIVVRPLFNGNSSGGVGAEIRQYCRLWWFKRANGRGGVWVFTAAEDELAWRRNQAAHWLHRDHFKDREDIDWSAVRREIETSEVDFTLSAGTAAEMKDEIDRKAPLWLEQLTKLALEKWSVQLVPRPPGSDMPLRDPQAVAALEGKAQLGQQLARNMTPTYVSEWEWFREELDTEVPTTICWGSPWPKAQDIGGLCQKIVAQ